MHVAEKLVLGETHAHKFDMQTGENSSVIQKSSYKMGKQDNDHAFIHLYLMGCHSAIYNYDNNVTLTGPLGQ